MAKGFDTIGVRVGRAIACALAAVVIAGSCGAAVPGKKPSTANMQRPPNSSTQANRPEYSSESEPADFVLEAQIIVGKDQGTIRSGQVIAIDARFNLAHAVSASQLQRVIQVLIDGKAAEKIEPAASKGDVDTGAGGYESQEPSGSAPSNKRDKIDTTFLVRVPDIAPGTDWVVIALYSERDGRTVATVQRGVQDTGSIAANPDVKPADSPTADAARTYWGWLSALGGLFGALVGWLMYRRAQKNTEELAQNAERWRKYAGEVERAHSTEADLDTTNASAEPSVPVLPASTADAASQDRLVLVLGPGASAQAGVPTSTELWLEVLSMLEPPASADGDTGNSRLRNAILTRGPSAVIEAIVATFGRDAVLAALGKAMHASRIRLGAFHERLAKLPCTIVIDMTLDSVARQAFPASRVFTPATSDGLTSWIRERQRCILKPMGMIDRPDDVSLTSGDLRQMLSRAPEFDKALAGLFSSHSFLFIGLGLPGLDDYLQTLPPSLGSASREHVAVIPHKPAADLWQAGTGRRYGIQVASFTPSADYGEIVKMLDDLLEGVRRSQASAARTSQVAQQHLRRAVLENIGVFEKLELEFGESWTLFFGNNGGGKSTILRAICLALAGGDPRASKQAAKLLRNGARSGRITIELGQDTIVTELVRDENSVRVSSPQLTPLQAGRVLVLAFPVLRGVSLTSPSGPKEVRAQNPSVDDVIPLLEGLTDSRLDSLKQWIVNTFVQSEGAPGNRESKMLGTLRSLVQEMIPGEAMKLSRVDKKSWTIWVETREGEVEFDSISQGMSSIFNWVGVLLRRLYDVYPQSADPEKERALVFIDEIDAHLHPNWQRRLVQLTRNHFPNVQIVATSHSALLAGAVRKDELRIVERDPETGKMSAAVAKIDVEGQRADDILTSSIFALDTTRSPEAEDVIREYVALYEKVSPTDQEHARLAVLEKQVAALNYGSPRTVLPGAAEAAADPLNLVGFISGLSPEAAAALSAKLSGHAEGGADQRSEAT